MHPYFQPPLPHIFAHRGLASEVEENTQLSFELAIKSGATHIETDVRSTRDGIAVLVHDPLIEGLRVADTFLVDLPDYVYPLSQALRDFPDTFFNIDIKAKDAIEPTVTEVQSHNAHERVLIASFSGARRKKTHKRIPGSVTSGSRGEFLTAFFSSQLGLYFLTKRALKNVDALQIPTRVLGMSTSRPRILNSFINSGTFVYYWTINDPTEMTELVANGAHGVVTDRSDVAHSVFTSR